MKKAEEYIESAKMLLPKDGIMYMMLENTIRKVQLDAIEYAVKKCVENAEIGICQNDNGCPCQWDSHFVDRQSILSTIDQIKEEMK